jgi:hypothetical protein
MIADLGDSGKKLCIISPIEYLAIEPIPPPKNIAIN